MLDNISIDLTEDQRNSFNRLSAFASFNTDHCVMTLEGPAGTGKTTLVSQLVDEMISSLSIAIAAPTNKAVHVLREKIEVDDPLARIEYASIHSFLGLRMTERDDGTQECKPDGTSRLHEYDLVVIDESSMIDDDMLGRILNARRNARILFVGDSAQLPPVSSKTLNATSPVFSRIQNKATLTEVVRQAQDNPIIRLSMAIREAIERNEAMAPTDIAKNLPKPGTVSKAGLCYGDHNTIALWVAEEIKAGRDARALAFTNTQVLKYNEIIHEIIHGYTESPYVPGEKVIVHNPYDAKLKVTLRPATLYNSEELIVVSIDPAGHPRYQDLLAYKLTLLRDDSSEVEIYIAQDQLALERDISRLFTEWRALKDKGNHSEAKQFSRSAWSLRNAFASIRHAYALTTHKSQGSTFDTAIVDYKDLAKIRNAFDFNRALYVACTRPSEHLAIVV